MVPSGAGKSTIKKAKYSTWPSSFKPSDKFNAPQVEQRLSVRNLVFQCSGK